MEWTIDVGGGEVPIVLDDGGDSPVVVLAHGAGSHMAHATLVRLADHLRERGCRVGRFNFLYRCRGKGMPDPMPVLMRTYRSVVASIRERVSPARLVVGGHSMGGRVASMIAAEGDAFEGLLLFGYPLHPPGRTDKLRDAHLPAILVPTLQVNGTRDEFCDKALMAEIEPRLGPRWRVVWIEEADHSYAVKKSSGRTKADVDNDVRLALTEWLETLP